MEELNQLTHQIIGSAIEVHKALGPGLPRSAYERCLCWELSQRKIPFERRISIPVLYKGLRLEWGYHADLVVASAVLVQVKAVAEILPIHEAQLFTLLRLGGVAFRITAKLQRTGSKRQDPSVDPLVSSPPRP